MGFEPGAMSAPGQCDQIGQFLNIFDDKLSCKSGPDIWWQFCFFENITLWVKTDVATSW